MFAGLSSFPLTPLHEDVLDTVAFERLVRRVAGAGVDSITALGSTGSYAYLSRAERQVVVATAVGASAGIPVIAGISALRTSQAIELAEDTQEAGAAAVLLAPISYQALTEDDVFGLYADVLEHLTETRMGAPQQPPEAHPRARRAGAGRGRARTDRDRLGVIGELISTAHPYPDRHALVRTIALGHRAASPCGGGMGGAATRSPTRCVRSPRRALEL